MAIFDNFPWTNVHQLNTDWLVKTVKQVKNKTDELDTNIELAKNYAESSKEYSELAQEAVESLQGLPYRMICIGDSYGYGYTPDGDIEGWPTRLKTRLGISDGNFFSNCLGNAGFCGTRDGRNFLTLITELAGTVTNPSTITDIVVAGGYNDQSFTNDDIQNGIRTFLTYCKNTYPIAKVHVGCIAFTFSNDYTTGYNIYGKLNNVLAAYQMAPFLGENGRYMNNIEFSLIDKTFFSSDLIHPNNIGEGFIAMYMAQYIKTGSCDVAHRENDDLTFTAGITSDNPLSIATVVHNNITSIYANPLFLNCNLTYSGGSILVDIGTLGNKTCFHGTEYTSTPTVITGFVAKTTGTPYTKFTGYAYISKGKLYLRFTLLNDTNSGFYSGNITAISIATPFKMNINTYAQY